MKRNQKHFKKVIVEGLMEKVIVIKRSSISVLLASFLIFSAWSISFSQTIQIGPGYGESWNQDASPVNIARKRTVCQFVYTAEELTKASAPTINPITSLGFYITQEPGEVLPNYTIKLKHVTVSDVSNALGTSDWIEVAGPFNYSPTAGGYDMIPLSTPFTWNGTDNIGVEICWSRAARKRNRGTIRIYGSNNGFRYRSESGGGTSCGDIPNTVRSTKPHIQMIFVPGNTTTWNGSLSSDWFNHGNWDTGIPNKLMDAVIPFPSVVMPEIQGGEARVKNLRIDAGSTLIFPGSDTLSIYGNWLMNGTLDCGKSTVIFRGLENAVNTLNGVLNQEFYNLEIRSAAGASLNTGSYFVQGSLRLRGGDFISNNLLTLKSTASGTGRMTKVSNICSYQLDMTDLEDELWNGAFVTLQVDGQTVEHYSGTGPNTLVNLPIPNGSSFSLLYTAGQWENENIYELIDPLGNVLLEDGPSPGEGQVFSGVATCPFNSSFVGDITSQRYLQLANNGWRELAVGVENQTLEDWQNDGLIMTGFPGSDYPGFSWTSVYSYEENNANGDKNNGWVSPTNINNSINFQHGTKVYIGSVTRTLEVTGPPNVGSQTIDLDFQDDSGAIDQEGWNLIGNPFVCSVNWDNVPALNKTGIDNALWIWNATAGNYGIYVGGSGGIGTNDVEANIGSSQGFWVHANDINPTLTFTEDDKTESDPRFVKSVNHQSRLNIHLSSGVNTFYDEAILVWKDDASSNIDDKDGLKLYSSEATAPSLAFEIEAEEYSVNSIHVNEAHYSTLLKTLAGETGIYTLSFDGIELLTEIPCIILEDMVEDSLIDLHLNSTYDFVLSEMYTGTRFKLHVGQWYSGESWERCTYLPELINQEELILADSDNTIDEIQNQEEITLKVTENILDGAVVYPNPASDFLQIDFPNATNEIIKLDVLSITGQVLFTTKIANGMRIDIQGLSYGTYILRIGDNRSGFLMKTFIKK